MKLDFEVIRWRFLIIGFLCLFFLIGAARFTVNKIRNYKRTESWELKGTYPSGSLGAQVLDAQKRAKNQ